jgi:hypothetical protein
MSALFSLGVSIPQGFGTLSYRWKEFLSFLYIQGMQLLQAFSTIVTQELRIIDRFSCYFNDYFCLQISDKRGNWKLGTQHSKQQRLEIIKATFRGVLIVYHRSTKSTKKCCNCFLIPHVIYFCFLFHIPIFDHIFLHILYF